ncbi:MAG: glycerophosphodiester phosphodiesterase family protein [Maricaulaceae bacterium]|nr:glycerophosphodiester phosphodiesterase family protein [Maricaulaceae bacterium]
MKRFVFAGALALALAACGAPQETARLDGAGGQTPVAQLLDCARESGVSLVAAHRAGFGPGWPENSAQGIRRAAAAGAMLAEIDLRWTADGHIVLMHDETIDRTTTGSGAVADMTLEELRRFHLLDPDGVITTDRVPTLDEAFAAARDTGVVLQLDLKTVTAAEAARAAREAGMAGQSMIIAYRLEQALAAQAEAPEIGISLGFRDLDALHAAAAQGLDVSALAVWLGAGPPDPAFPAALAERGIEAGAHDFAAEARGEIDYAAFRNSGVELLASDDIAAAAAVFGTGHCPLPAAP